MNEKQQENSNILFGRLEGSRITKPKGVFGRVLASKEIKGKSFGRLEATA